MNREDKIGFLFDLDGVIIDSESEYDKIWEEIDRCFPTGVENLAKKIKGCTLPKILNDYYPDKKIQDKVASRLHEMESQMKYDYIDGSEEFLALLRSKGCATALVTSSLTDKMQNLVSQIPNILSYFDFVVTGDLVTKSKPSPEGYLKAAGRIEREAHYCIVFEDSLQGVMAGRAADAFVVGMYGTLEAEKIAPYSDILVGSLSELHLDDLIEQVLNR